MDGTERCHHLTCALYSAADHGVPQAEYHLCQKPRVACTKLWHVTSQLLPLQGDLERRNAVLEAKLAAQQQKASSAEARVATLEHGISDELVT